MLFFLSGTLIKHQRYKVMGKLILIITAAALFNHTAETKEDSGRMGWPDQERVIKCDVEGIAEMHRLGFEDDIMEIVCNE